MMADGENAVVLESKATAEQQAAAEKIGWIPPARYKGEPERFVDADTYIERGETVLPIVKKQLVDVRAENTVLRAEQQRTAAALKSAEEAIEQIEERHTVATQKAVEEARKQLKLQLAAASEAGDHAGVAELTDQMTRLNVAEEEAPPAKKNGVEHKAFVPPPELVAWNEENPWFGKDRRRTSLALGIAQELREAGEKSQGREFFEKVAAEVEKTLAPKEAPRGDKVEGARNGSESESRTPRGKGYTALPADAKTACDADAKRFVGPDKKYKDITAWRNRYAEIYYEQGA